jgi:hypothetical protein
MEYGVGGKINGLTIGIVNEEVAFKADCGNQSYLLAEPQGYGCYFNHLSCRFINAIDELDMKKVNLIEGTSKSSFISHNCFAFLDLLRLA